jgi:hypothetical protein
LIVEEEKAGNAHQQQSSQNGEEEKSHAFYLMQVGRGYDGYHQADEKEPESSFQSNLQQFPYNESKEDTQQDMNDQQSEHLFFSSALHLESNNRKGRFPTQNEAILIPSSAPHQRHFTDRMFINLLQSYKEIPIRH